MPIIDKKLERGDVRFHKCKVCDSYSVPIDTRKKSIFQFTQCRTCGSVVKYKHNGFKKDGTDKMHQYQWDARWQGNKKYIDRCLKVELDDEGACKAILSPVPERIESEDPDA